jgi:hypothetical protein
LVVALVVAPSSFEDCTSTPNLEICRICLEIIACLHLIASHSNAISGKVVNPAQNILKFVDVSFKFFLLHRFPTLNTLARPEEWAMLYTIDTNIPRSFSFFPQYLPQHFYYTALRLNQLHGSLFFLFLPSSYWYFSMLTAATHCQL